MKFPNHLILDVSTEQVSQSNQYWVYKYIFNFKKTNIVFENFTFHKIFLFKKENLTLNKIIKNQKKFTLTYSLSNPSLFFKDAKNKTFEKLYKPRLKVKSKLLYSKEFGKEIRDYNLNTSNFDEKYIKRITFYFDNYSNNSLFRSNKLWSLFDINFLRKEKMYTKLKYSRVPQYDIVSGGAAALLAGFLGFLICEKFGFELADSGDFYILFMYIVFLCFSLRPLFKIMDASNFSWNILSLKWLLFFIQTLFILIINKFHKLFK